MESFSRVGGVFTREGLEQLLRKDGLHLVFEEDGKPETRTYSAENLSDSFKDLVSIYGLEKAMEVAVVQGKVIIKTTKTLNK